MKQILCCIWILFFSCHLLHNPKMRVNEWIDIEINFNNFNKDLTNTEKTLKIAKEEIKRLEKLIQEYEKLEKELLKDKNISLKLIKQLRESKVQLEGEKRGLENSVNELNKELDKIKGEKESLEKERDSLKESKTKLERERDKLKEDKNTLNKDIIEKKEKIDELEQKIKNLEKERDSLRDDKERLNNLKESLNNKLDELKESLKEKKDEIDELKRNLNNVKDKAEREYLEIQKGYDTSIILSIFDKQSIFDDFLRERLLNNINTAIYKGDSCTITGILKIPTKTPRKTCATLEDYLFENVEKAKKSFPLAALALKNRSGNEISLIINNFFILYNAAKYSIYNDFDKSHTTYSYYVNLALQKFYKAVILKNIKDKKEYNKTYNTNVYYIDNLLEIINTFDDYDSNSYDKVKEAFEILPSSDYRKIN